MKNRKPPGKWVTYERAYLITLGLVFIGLTITIWFKQGDTYPDWPTWGKGLFYLLPALGILIVGIGCSVKKQSLDYWADRMSTHEACIILMIIAFPVYLLMSCFEAKKR